MMPTTTQGGVHNRLLALMASEDFALLAPDLEPVSLVMGQVLIEPNRPIERVHFPESGVVSQIAYTPAQVRLEVGLYGRDGMTAMGVLLGTDQAPYQHLVQIDGHAFTISTVALKRGIERSPSLLTHLLRYVQAFSVQMSYTAVSIGSENIGERLARWLLMCHDRIEGDDLPITHEFLAMMLAVRRSGVTEATHVLEGEHLIKATRGNIRVLDRSGLEAAAGDSYGVPEGEYERFIGAFRRVSAVGRPQGVAVR